MLEINRLKSRKTTPRLVVSLLSLLLAVAVPAWSRAQEPKQDHSGLAAGHEIRIPQTPQDHRDLAERYQQKAAGYREEVEAHKKMLAEYSKRVARNPKDPGENPYIRKMRVHCEKYINATESAAREAEEMAKFHTFRARELEGK
jgi:hypothetical protein